MTRQFLTKPMLVPQKLLCSLPLRRLAEVPTAWPNRLHLLLSFALPGSSLPFLCSATTLLSHLPLPCMPPVVTYLFSFSSLLSCSQYHQPPLFSSSDSHYLHGPSLPADPRVVLLRLQRAAALGPSLCLTDCPKVQAHSFIVSHSTLRQVASSNLGLRTFVSPLVPSLSLTAPWSLNIQ